MPGLDDFRHDRESWPTGLISMIWVLLSLIGLLAETLLIIVLGRRATAPYEDVRPVAADARRPAEQP
jgi:hypothetical protein